MDLPGPAVNAAASISMMGRRIRVRYGPGGDSSSLCKGIPALGGAPPKRPPSGPGNVPERPFAAPVESPERTRAESLEKAPGGPVRRCTEKALRRNPDPDCGAGPGGSGRGVSRSA
ncbi:hypothetical protein GCM10009731_01290 [Streptomyces globosus]